MDCKHFDQVVMDLLYGEADEKVSAEANRHAERCERCASNLADLRATRKALCVPLVEAPSTVEQHAIRAAREAQHQISLPRRVGRWISWAGGYAMRPQIAMAALLLLMVGSSLLLIQGRPGSEQVGVVHVTEQGVPEREVAEHDIDSTATVDLPLAGDGRRGRRSSKGRDARSRGAREGAAASGKPRGQDKRVAEEPTRDHGGVGVDDGGAEHRLPSPTGAPGTNQQRNASRSPGGTTSSTPAADDYARAVAMFRARDYANAYRAFDAVAMQGGANAPSAALYAAKAVRASSGCANALPRFESVIARFGNAGAGIQAKWEAATCARIVGDFTRARILYRSLAKVASQRERAERELARVSTRNRARAAHPASSAGKTNEKAAADRKKEPHRDSAQEAAY